MPWLRLKDAAPGLQCAGPLLHSEMAIRKERSVRGLADIFVMRVYEAPTSPDFYY